MLLGSALRRELCDLMPVLTGYSPGSGDFWYRNNSKIIFFSAL